jgi:hypothetical protein
MKRECRKETEFVPDPVVNKIKEMYVYISLPFKRGILLNVV